ncbi:adhesion G protein-coupled receptor E4-like [Hermetia illucens]|nr:adhesion G protein-coupled receptor E4-like [Hermetia illucens]
METLYTGHIHGFGPPGNGSVVNAFGAQWGAQGSLIALGVVLGSSISLVGLAFAFITYSLFSDLRSLAGTALLSLLASLFMAQLLFVIGVGGVQDSELCLSLSLALLFMKLASLCWLCCCCHHALTVFRNSVNLIPQPEPKMGRMLAQYSAISWGFPLLMVGIAVAFKYKEKEIKTKLQLTAAEIVQELLISKHCWLMEGKAYIWAYMIPAIILLLFGYHLAFQARNTAKVSAQMQVDSKCRNKLIKRRMLQSGLFIKILFLFTFVNVLGSFAALMRMNQLWAAYSIAQGLQGLITALLVTCNCRVLKLYTASRGRKERHGIYNCLRDGEGGRYGVLTVTNPNYDEDNAHITPETDQTLVKASYREESFVERKESKKCCPAPVAGISTDLTSSLPATELSSGPPPQPL